MLDYNNNISTVMVENNNYPEKLMALALKR